MRHALEISDLVVNVGGHAVLRGINCAMPPARVIGVLGPPGSGKSTLLRCLVGYQEIAAGEVRVLGLPAGAPDLRRRIGFAPGAGALYTDLSVGRNVRYFATVAGSSRSAADRALAEVGMSELANALAGSLPAELQARLSLACALVAGPEVLVLDELTEGLDPVSRSDLWTRFGALAARGVTVVVASEVLDDAVRCDRALLLHGGGLIAEDTPEGLLDQTGASSVEQAFVRLCRPDGAGSTLPAEERIPAAAAR